MRSTTSSTTHPPRLRLTTEGLVWLGVAILLGFLGWLKNLNPLLIFAYGMLGLLILNGVLAVLHVRRVAVARRSMLPVFADKVVPVGVLLQNISTRVAVVGVTEHDPNTTQTDSEVESGDRPSQLQFTALRPGVQFEYVKPRVFMTRGRVQLPPPIVWSAVPFGLLRYERNAGFAMELVVLPALGTANPETLRRWVMRKTLGESRTRRVMRRATPDQADVRGVRPYRDGDSMRWVHWRTTARHGELMVREYDIAPSADLVLVVEPWVPGKASKVDKARLETALSLAATVAWTWSQSYRTRVKLVLLGAEPIVRDLGTSEITAIQALAPLADIVGDAWTGSIDPQTFDRSLATATRLVVSSRPSTPIASVLARGTGREFITIDPLMTLPWYRPPS